MSLKKWIIYSPILLVLTACSIGEVVSFHKNVRQKNRELEAFKAELREKSKTPVKINDLSDTNFQNAHLLEWERTTRFIETGEQLMTQFESMEERGVYTKALEEELFRPMVAYVGGVANVITLCSARGDSLIFQARGQKEAEIVDKFDAGDEKQAKILNERWNALYKRLKLKR